MQEHDSGKQAETDELDALVDAAADADEQDLDFEGLVAAGENVEREQQSRRDRWDSLTPEERRLRIEAAKRQHPLPLWVKLGLPGFPAAAIGFGVMQYMSNDSQTYYLPMGLMIAYMAALAAWLKWRSEIVDKSKLESRAMSMDAPNG